MLNMLMACHESTLKGIFLIGQKTNRSPYTFRHSLEMEFLNELMASQWFTHDEIELLQLNKTKSLLHHAYSNVPYYSRVFKATGFHPEDFKSLEDLNGLPILTKKDLQEKKPDLLSRVAHVDTYRSNSTGGSTGHPVSFYQSYKYKAWNKAANMRNLTMCGYRPGERVAYLWGSDYDSKGHRGWKNRFFNDLLRKNLVWINTFELTEPLLEQAARTLVRFRPRLLVAYVSSATLLAKFVKERNIRGIRPTAIQTSAELLTQPQRNLLEEVFGCPVFDRYGCREVGHVAHECGAHNGLHLIAETNYTEFLVDGKPAKPGEMGMVTVTNLNNWAMPFIRYQLGDLGRPAQGNCPCGRGLPLMEVLEGRSTDIITTPSGKLLHGEFFTHLFYKLPAVRQFQVVQKKIDVLEIKIVPMTGFNRDATLKHLEETIKSHADPEFKISFSLQEKISPSSSGKFRFVFSEVPPEKSKMEST